MNVQKKKVKIDGEIGEWRYCVYTDFTGCGTLVVAHLHVSKATLLFLVNALPIFVVFGIKTFVQEI